MAGVRFGPDRALNARTLAVLPVLLVILVFVIKRSCGR